MREVGDRLNWKDLVSAHTQKWAAKGTVLSGYAYQPLVEAGYMAILVKCKLL